ncbi:aminotransferase class V-fold PLP-dependent enzyme, partial [candidate division WOR-3 bacterium]|nr:aminotransferase class V-fold PLP-dependent enzyme [candidate division WOR-3 bacterium]
VHAGLNPDGSLDLDDFAAKLKQHRGRVALVAVTGASNVTGCVNPIHHLARLAHEHGARIAVDAAQVAPHRPIDMRPAEDPEHLDFLAFSGHKAYAPYGVGVLAGCREVLHTPEPTLVGGGVVDLVTLDSAVWRGLPGREEAGTPAVAGAVAMAAAAGLLESVGWDAICRHEDELTRYALARLGRIPGIRVFGKASADDVADRFGVIAFSLGSLDAAFVASVLAYEAGVGARCGLFCAHPYVFSLLGLDAAAVAALRERVAAGKPTGLPGVVRASVGAYNDRSDLDALCDCLEELAAGRHGRYEQDPGTGEYRPAGRPRLRPEDYFRLTPRLPGA